MQKSNQINMKMEIVHYNSSYFGAFMKAQLKSFKK